MPSNDDEDSRYHDLLKLIGQQRVDFQAFEAKVLRQQLEYWKATTVAIRTLTDWWTEATDKETKQRAARQIELDRQLNNIQADQQAMRKNQRLRMTVEVLVIVAVLALFIGVWFF